MPLQLLCPGCQKQLRIDESASGQTVRCPRCGISFTAAGAATPHSEHEAGIADRPMQPRVAGEPQFDPAVEADLGSRPRSSSKLPLILVLVIGGAVLLVGGVVLVLVLAGAWLFWAASPSAAPSGSVAMQADAPAQEMADQMRGPEVIGNRDIVGPGENGRLGFPASRLVVAVAFIDDGKTLAAASDDGEVRLWDLDPPQSKSIVPPGHPPGRREHITDMAVAPDGKSFVTVSHGGVLQIMDVGTKQEKAVLSAPELAEFSLWAVAYSPTGKTIATAHGNGVVKLWDVQTEKLRTSLQGHKDQVTSVAFSRDGELLASGGNDGMVVIWNVAQRRELATIRDPRSPNAMIWALAFAPDGNSIAFGGTNKVIRIWDLKKQEQRAVCPAPTGRQSSQDMSQVSSAAFSPDGQLLAAASGDGTVHLWDPVTGQRRARLQCHGGPIGRLAFSPDSKKLAVGVAGVDVWDLTKVEMLKGP